MHDGFSICMGIQKICMFRPNKMVKRLGNSSYMKRSGWHPSAIQHSWLTSLVNPHQVTNSCWLIHPAGLHPARVSGGLPGEECLAPRGVASVLGVFKNWMKAILPHTLWWPFLSRPISNLSIHLKLCSANTHFNNRAVFSRSVNVIWPQYPKGECI